MPRNAEYEPFSMVTERAARMSDPLSRVFAHGSPSMKTTTTAQRLCRTVNEEVAPAPFEPTEDWIEAFEQQHTEELRARALRFARSRARLVARAGGRVDDLYASELVHDALSDTLLGVLAWDPRAVPLETHVFGAVRSRTNS